MSTADSKSGRLLLSVLLALMTLAAFWEVRSHEFVDYDDNVYVFANPIVVAGFSTQSVGQAFASGKHPLTWISHMLDWELHGPWAGGHLLTNLLFHVANVLLLFCVLLRATGATWQSAAVAMLFAIHPLHVESVAWASQRKDVLSTTFWLLCTWAYVRHVEAPGIARYGLIALFLSLGLMSKAMLVTLPFTLLLLDYWPLGRWADGDERRARVAWRLVREKLPLFAMVAIASAIAFWVQDSGGGTAMLRTLSWAERVGNASVAYSSYLHKTFWPVDLMFFYPHPLGSLTATQVSWAALALIAISVLVCLARSHRYLTVGWLWYLGTLIPVIGFVQIGKQAMADRYTYIPHIGLFVALVWGIAEVSVRWRYRTPLLTAAAVSVAIALMLTTQTQVAHWRNSTSLAEHAIAISPDNAVAQRIAGRARMEAGDLDRAIGHLQRAIEVDPEFADLRVDLANALSDAGRDDDAISELGRALAIEPEHAIARYNLALIHIRRREVDPAITQLRRAIASDPQYASAHFGLGTLLAGQRRLADAEHHFLEALRGDPQNPAIHVQLGAVYAISKRPDLAIQSFETALGLAPTHTQARKFLEIARQQQSEQRLED